MKTILISVTLFALIFVSCNKESDIIVQKDQQESVILDDEIQLRKEASVITATLTNDEEIINEVFQAVKERNYGEESVLFADLLDEENTLLKSATTSRFRSEFINALNKNQLKSAEVDNSDDILEALQNGKIQLYWPYHENWDGKAKPTITFNDGIHKVENTGYKADGSKVLVNEAYAMINPVWIINALEFDGDLDQVRSYFEKIQKLKSASKIKSATTVEYITCQVYQIQCNSQTDPFYDGGPEIKIVRAGLVDEWHADISDWQFQTNFSRPDVRYNRWLTIYNTWDSQWESTLDYQVIGCYDYDGMGDWESHISGNIIGSYTYQENGVDITVDVNTGFSKNYDGDESAIYTNSWGREWARYNLSYAQQQGLGFVQTKWLN